MSMYEKWNQGTLSRDAEALIACLHDDFTFVRHQTGTTMNKSDMAAMLRSFMSNAAVTVQNQSCLYENHEVMIEHTVMDFADGSRESVIVFNRLSDGLIIHTQTGATVVQRVS